MTRITMLAVGASVIASTVVTSACSSDTTPLGDGGSKDSGGDGGGDGAGDAGPATGQTGCLEIGNGHPDAGGCDGTWYFCDDGHHYRVTCADDTNPCSCQIDGVTVGTGITNICALMDLAVIDAINQGCGWSISLK